MSSIYLNNKRYVGVSCADAYVHGLQQVEHLHHVDNCLKLITKVTRNGEHENAYFDVHLNNLNGVAEQAKVRSTQIDPSSILRKVWYRI